MSPSIVHTSKIVDGSVVIKQIRYSSIIPIPLLLFFPFTCFSIFKLSDCSAYIHVQSAFFFAPTFHSLLLLQTPLIIQFSEPVARKKITDYRPSRPSKSIRLMKLHPWKSDVVYLRDTDAREQWPCLIYFRSPSSLRKHAVRAPPFCINDS